MKLFQIGEAFRQALISLKSNKLRSFLASFGVVIGISFVIIMGFLLTTLDNALYEAIKFTGSDMLFVDKWSWAGSHNWKLVRQRKPINYKQATELSERIKSAEMAYPIAWQWGAKAKYKNETVSNIRVQGTSFKFSKAPGGKITIGRVFTQFEDRIGADVAVIGYKIYETLFPDEYPIEKIIKISGYKLRVIGVVSKQGNFISDFSDNLIYIPLRKFHKIYGSYGRSYTIAVKAGQDGKYLDYVRDEVRGIMRNIRNLPPHKDDDFSINETKTFEEAVATFRLSVWGIGIGFTALSFIVGIIGIMNIMFVSVVERTREIGIRKALGARRSTILYQFIVEAAVLSLIGAIISFILCSVLIFSVVSLVRMLDPDLTFLSFFVPAKLFIISAIVSILIGILAGFIPALRAASLDPVTALRYE
jgi:putative ABC transport system permease protein